MAILLSACEADDENIEKIRLLRNKENKNHMSTKRHEPLEITPHLFQLGTPAFPAYLSLGEEGMIIEGGTGPTFQIMVDQVKALGIEPKKIKYVVLTHTHPDHIGAVPHFHRVWPHMKLLASPIGAQILGKRELFKEFQLVDLGIAQLMKAKEEIDTLPAPVGDYAFVVDATVKEGDRIDLGDGIVWSIYDTPGHAPCQSPYLRKRKIPLPSAMPRDSMSLKRISFGQITLNPLTNTASVSESWQRCPPKGRS
jgi:hypothetical protein